jgi:hypothetical protein
MATRKDLYNTLCRDLSGTYVEIGTCWGGFAKWLVQFTPLTKLVCVDPYRKFSMDEYNDTLNTTSQEFLDVKFEKVKADLDDLSDGVATIMRTTSSEAAKEFPDKSLSFVYIDGNHCYKAAKQDILAWIGKVKPGGILAGDDVESIDEPHDENGDLRVVHAGDPSGNTFGLYGVHKALVDTKAEFPWFDYTVSDGQFWWRNPPA